jgi:ERF superfamily
MNKSESIAKLAEALSKAQGAMKNAIKDSANPFFKSKYADLASVSDACRAELAANGLAIAQLPTMRDGKMVLEYVLMHASGEFIGSEIEMTPVKSDPQGIGSAITYARRYTLAGITGVATEDDDGNAASGNKAETRQAPGPALSFKKKTESAAPNGGQGDTEGIIKPTPEAADSHADTVPEPVRAAVAEATPRGNSATAIELSTLEQQDWMRMSFKEELPAKFKKNADTLRRDWLKLNGYHKDGVGTSKMIPRHEFKVIAKRLIEYATTFSI